MATPRKMNPETGISVACLSDMRAMSGFISSDLPDMFSNTAEMGTENLRHRRNRWAMPASHGQYGHIVARDGH